VLINDADLCCSTRGNVHGGKGGTHPINVEGRSRRQSDVDEGFREYYVAAATTKRCTS
jgi:hypothetical protein